MARNPWFVSGAMLIIFQQALMAIAVYQLGSAGRALAANAFILLRDKVAAFFLIALAAYLVSACVELIAARLKATLWRNYVRQVIDEVGARQELSSSKNRKTLLAWLGSEAPATLEHAVAIYYGLISVASGIVFTLYAFHALLGDVATSVMGTTILISFIFVSAVKGKVGHWASEIQQRRLLVVNGIDTLWSNSLQGTERMRSVAYDLFQARTLDYAQGYSAYTRLEQAVACVPIVLAVMGMVSYLFFFPVAENAWGVLIAVLPRSLQLFGNVHSLSVYGSKFLLYRKKISNLATFSHQLERQGLERQIQRQQIVIKDIASDQAHDMDDFLSLLRTSKILSGRYLITGRNGSGKTSFLKSLRSQFPTSILLLPDVTLFEDADGLSTGEQRMHQIKCSLQYAPPLLFLDEWDAHLDAWHRDRIDRLLSEKARHMLIVEVRHKGAIEVGVI
ncbi:ATP-binding cassette domain-containing protein [Pseudomonas poae]|uniref:Uncharacterized protein n=1 Tax=Pseudomonas poae TaxID=200451 RepID=A0A2S9E9Q3_9PSED|nr:ABC transporter ATP-binding protein [Pseudomonas poae]PRA27286.1 hypothetical protein CQZ97_18365 [Pseudomonas poae]PRC11603.1 hypothetical protein CQZ99_24805 [Pseudomonas poae]